MVREIALTRGEVALVDDQDFDRVNAFSWFVLASEGGLYAGRFERNSTGRQLILLHRFIAEPGPGLEVDHIDMNRFNCTRANLRIATRSQNSANKKLMANNRSGFKGVSWYSRSSRWRAYICCAGKARYLGAFNCKEAAARAYDEAARELFGPFARLNFPDSGELSAIN